MYFCLGKGSFSNYFTGFKMSDDQGQKYRVSVEAALKATLRATLRDTMQNAKQFALRSKVSEGTLSEFLNNKRNIQLATFESLLYALTNEQYEYFLRTLVDGNALIRDQIEGNSPLEEENLDESMRRAFFALVASYCYKCSRKDQLDLLAVIYSASCQNPLLRPRRDNPGK